MWRAQVLYLVYGSLDGLSLPTTHHLNIHESRTQRNSIYSDLYLSPRRYDIRSHESSVALTVALDFHALVPHSDMCATLRHCCASHLYEFRLLHLVDVLTHLFLNDPSVQFTAGKDTRRSFVCPECLHHRTAICLPFRTSAISFSQSPPAK